MPPPPPTPSFYSRLGSLAVSQWRWYLPGALFLLGTNLCGAAGPYLLKRAVDSLEEGKAEEIPRLAVMLVGVAVFLAGFRVLSRIYMFNGGRQVEFALRNRLYAHLMTLSPRFFGTAPVGDLISRTTSDIGNVRLLLGPGILNLVNTLLVFVTAAVPMFLIDAPLALLSLLPFPLLVLGTRGLSQKAFRFTFEAQAKLSALSVAVHETIIGHGVVRAYALEETRDRAFQEASSAYLHKQLAAIRMRTALMPLTGSLGGLGRLAIFLLGGWQAARGNLSVGDVTAFLGYLGLLLWPTMAVGWIIGILQQGRASLERLDVLFQAQAEVEEPKREQVPGGLPQKVQGGLSFHGLRFRYGDNEILRGVDLLVRPGEQVAILGPSGSGKSTLLQLIPRLCDSERGQVLLDGRPVQDFPLSLLRRSVAFVPQEPFLFSMSVRQNVEFGTGPQPDEVVWEALRLACLDEEVSRFPQGLDTVVGEKGVTLSGGQRQRLTIARAAVLKPRLWVFDDCLAAVDAETERRILRNIREMTRGTTTLFVTHRALGLAEMDRIAILSQGRVKESGTHQELLDLQGWYSLLYRRQKLDEEQGVPGTRVSA